MLKNMLVIPLALATIPMQAHAETHKAKQGNASQQPTTAASPIAPQQVDGPALKSKPGIQGPYEIRIVSTAPKDAYDKAVLWLNFTLVVVGIGGICVAVSTLRKIERQTKATEDAAEAALAGMKQWIDLTGWKTKLKRNASGHEMEFTFRVSNPTNLLITTEKGHITFTAPRTTKITFIYRPAPLGPKNPLIVRFSRPVTQLQADGYDQGLIIGFTVTGAITYRNAFEKRVVQRFAGLISSCKGRRTNFEATVDMGHGETADQNPN